MRPRFREHLGKFRYKFINAAATPLAHRDPGDQLMDQLHQAMEQLNRCEDEFSTLTSEKVLRILRG